MRVVVTGSLAYDYIMNFPGLFKDHILPDRVHMLSVSFLVDSMKRMRGGVAGNIAYSLALLGLQPLVVAAAGQDFGEYRQWMTSQGVDASGVHEVIGEFTPRGGIAIFPYASYAKKSVRYQKLRDDRLFNYRPGGFTTDLSKLY